jgi:hypothetical protein
MACRSLIIPIIGLRRGVLTWGDYYILEAVAEEYEKLGYIAPKPPLWGKCYIGILQQSCVIIYCNMTFSRDNSLSIKFFQYFYREN